MSAALPQGLAGDGFAFVPADRMRGLLEARGSLSDWPAFSASWDDLPVDGYMADLGRYRRRRHAVFAVDAAGAIVRQPQQPHYQALDYNPVNGGIERWFGAVADSIADGASFRTLLRFCSELFGQFSPATAWQVEAHQFRIEAVGPDAGQPTPEGMHRDGVDYVLVLLVRRYNIDSGTTMIGNAADGFFDSFTLTDPFDAALVDDHRVFHGVTPVRAHDPSQPAFRDVLVLTFKKA